MSDRDGIGERTVRELARIKPAVSVQRLEDGSVLVFANFHETAKEAGGVVRRLYLPSEAEIVEAIAFVEREVAEIDAQHQREAN